MSEPDIERLVQAAVRAVLAELEPAGPPEGPRVRVLLGNTPKGLDYALAALREVGKEGPRFEYAVTTGERAQAHLGHLRELPGTAAAKTVEEWGCPREFARGADAVVAATLDRPTAVRVALTMAETFADRFLLEALASGKPVVVVTDGFEIEAPAATPQLRHALAEPAARLETFGARCVPSTELAVALREALAGGGLTAPSTHRVVTVEDVEAADGALVLPPGAIVTPLAAERARELGVALRRVPG